ncbi:60S acidic ribosomal protein P1 [Salmonella sp. s51090]|uniref:60S acidic ribosomal protein P1 n=1 Tax=Salmonella sp. s51090 TaxID=3159651 RepID=UPI003980ABE1
MVNAAKVSVEPFWPGLFAKALEGSSIADLIGNVGSASAAPAAAAADAADAPAEEKKEEAKKSETESSDEDMGFGFFD